MSKVFWFLVLLAILPCFWQQLRGQTPAVRIDKATQKPKQHPTDATGNPINLQRGSQDAPIFVDGLGRAKSTQDTAETKINKEPASLIEGWTLGFAGAVAFFTFLLVIVGFCGVRAANHTLRAIEEQTTAIKKQTDLMGQQWVDYGDWKSQFFWGDPNLGVEPKLGISFVVVNRTAHPLFLPKAFIRFSIDRPDDQVTESVLFRFRDDCRLLPNKGPIDWVPLSIGNANFLTFNSGIPLRVRVEGELSYIGNAPGVQEQRFFGVLFCGNETTRFEEQTYGQADSEGSQSPI